MYTEKHLETMNKLLKTALYDEKSRSLSEKIQEYSNLLIQTKDVKLIQHANIMRYYNNHYVTNHNFIDELRNNLFNPFYEHICEKYPFLFVLDGRRKSFMKTEKKIRQNSKLGKDRIPNDLFAFRLVLHGATHEDCYTVLKDLESLCLLKGYILINTKDYIKNIKENGYSALHLILQSLDGKTFEIQIRTIEDHLQAEYSEKQNHKVYDAKKYDSKIDINLTKVKLQHSMFMPIKMADGSYEYYDEAGLNSPLIILLRRNTFTNSK